MTEAQRKGIARIIEELQSGVDKINDPNYLIKVSGTHYGIQLTLHFEEAGALEFISILQKALNEE